MFPDSEALKLDRALLVLLTRLCIFLHIPAVSAVNS